MGLLAGVALGVTALIPAGSAAAGRPVNGDVVGEPSARLTPAQLAGQRIIYSYPGLTPPESLLAHIRNGEAAGVIFFGENIASAAQIAGVVRQLRDAARQSPVHAPLLLMTDQEGGLIRRLPGAPELSEKQIGQSAQPVSGAVRAGTGAGDNLKSVGMNLNLAPVLDVVSVPGNFIDRFQRSYGSDPATVGKLGSAFIGAQQKTGVAATAKHFPGLGATPVGQNTDLEPVTITSSLGDLRARDEAAYPAAISAKVKLIMASWAIYPALDASRPAGLSPTVITSELRGRLGYHGVTITDALEAGALQAFGDNGRRAVLAARAGMDLILCSARDVSQGEAATQGLVGGLRNGDLNATAFQASVRRVTQLRDSLS
ncbi:glycoside hydrolase family 3 N-terminal domain-containing protein [Planosporangium thailandense]|uniref:glycoside hydrolase family 3 N-terminal domain-containing protein n=1 Tax=Planosporangium thailandense TaxID=765197 RepID=UPI00197C1C49